MTDIIHQYIDGSWTDAADGNVAELINPATGEVTGAVEQGSESDVDRAVAAARRAFSSFSGSSPGSGSPGRPSIWTRTSYRPSSRSAPVWPL